MNTYSWDPQLTNSSSNLWEYAGAESPPQGGTTGRPNASNHRRGLNPDAQPFRLVSPVPNSSAPLSGGGIHSPCDDNGLAHVSGIGHAAASLSRGAAHHGATGGGAFTEQQLVALAAMLRTSPEQLLQTVSHGRLPSNHRAAPLSGSVSPMSPHSHGGTGLSSAYPPHATGAAPHLAGSAGSHPANGLPNSHLPHESEEVGKIRESVYKPRMVPLPLTLQQHADIYQRNHSHPTAPNTHHSSRNYPPMRHSTLRNLSPVSPDNDISNSLLGRGGTDLEVNNSTAEEAAATAARLEEYKAIITRWCRVARQIVSKPEVHEDIPGLGPCPYLEALITEKQKEYQAWQDRHQQQHASEEGSMMPTFPSDEELLQELSDRCKTWWTDLNTRKKQVHLAASAAAESHLMGMSHPQADGGTFAVIAPPPLSDNNAHHHSSFMVKADNDITSHTTATPPLQQYHNHIIGFNVEGTDDITSSHHSAGAYLLGNMQRSLMNLNGTARGGGISYPLGHTEGTTTYNEPLDEETLGAAYVQRLMDDLEALHD